MWRKSPHLWMRPRAGLYRSSAAFLRNFAQPLLLCWLISLPLTLEAAPDSLRWCGALLPVAPSRPEDYSDPLAVALWLFHLGLPLLLALWRFAVVQWLKVERKVRFRRYLLGLRVLDRSGTSSSSSRQAGS